MSNPAISVTIQDNGSGHNENLPPKADPPKESVESDGRKSVLAWAEQKKHSIRPDHARRRGDFYDHSPNRLEGAIQLQVCHKKWMARREELVTEEEYDDAISAFDNLGKPEPKPEADPKS